MTILLPPLQYTTYRRMQLAAQVGYGSESGFSRVFKREKGLSPARYRAAMVA